MFFFPNERQSFAALFVAIQEHLDVAKSRPARVDLPDQLETPQAEPRACL